MPLGHANGFNFILFIWINSVTDPPKTHYKMWCVVSTFVTKETFLFFVYIKDQLTDI